MPIDRTPTGLTGTAGEYFVAAELTLRGWLATVTIKNAPATDVLARRLSTGRVVAIQTKTASVGNKFTLGEKDELPSSADNEWYVFVGLDGLGLRPSFYVVPRNHIAGVLYAQHREWLSRPSRSGAPHRHSTRRTIARRELDGYREGWEALEQPTSNVPLAFKEPFLGWCATFGLPDGHPGFA